MARLLAHFRSDPDVEQESVPWQYGADGNAFETSDSKYADPSKAPLQNLASVNSLEPP